MIKLVVFVLILHPLPTGLAPSRPDSHSTSEALTPTTPTSSSQNRLGGSPSVNIISGLASGPGMDHMKAGGLAGLLGPPPKAPRGRKKIKAENTSGPLLVVPYPILADQGCVTVAPKEGKTYRLDTNASPGRFTARWQENRFWRGVGLERNWIELQRESTKLFISDFFHSFMTSCT